MTRKHGEDSSLDIQPLKPGTIVDSELIEIRKRDIILDIKWKSEVHLSKSEFKSYELEVGKKFALYLVTPDNGCGEAIVSREKAVHILGMQELKAAAENSTSIVANIHKQVRSGYLLTYKENNIFLPLSLSADIERLLAKDTKLIEVKIVRIQKFNDQTNCVASRKEFVEEHNKDKLQEFLTSTKVGDVVTGTVKHYTTFGIFVDLQYLDGLVHLSDISWRRTRNIENKYPKGTSIQTKVLDISDGRISLGIKQLEADPWSVVDKTLKEGDTCVGTICNITDYGMFVNIEEVGLEGLIHISAMSWSESGSAELAKYSIGQEVSARVLSINSNLRRISLSIKDTQANPWVVFAEKHKESKVIEGTVTKVTEFGLFVKVADHVEGLVHISDVDYFATTADLQSYKIGDVISCKISKINAEKQRVSLDIKHAKREYRDLLESMRIDDIVPLNVIRMKDGDAICEINSTKCRGIIYKSGSKNLHVGSEIKARFVRETNKELVFSLDNKQEHVVTKADKATFSQILEDAIENKW